MNGYDALSEAALAAHSTAIPRAQPATAPQIRPRETVAPLSEAISAADLEKLLILLHDLERQDDEEWDTPGPMREAVLTTQQRNELPDSAFAIPEDRAYPIHDVEHARNALARVAQFGTPEEKRRVRAAVRRRYPGIDVGGEEGGSSS